MAASDFPSTLDIIAPEPVVQYYDDYRIRILAGDYCVEGAPNGKVRIPYDLLVSLEDLNAAYDTDDQSVTAPSVVQCLPDGRVVSFPTGGDRRGCSMAVALGSDGTVYVVPYGFCNHIISNGTIAAKGASTGNDLGSFDITTGVGFSPGKTNKITFQMEWGIDQNDLSYTDTVVVYTDDSDTTVHAYLANRQGVQKYDWTADSGSYTGDGKYSYSWKQYNHRRYNMYHPATSSDIETYNRIVSYDVSAVSGSDGYIPTGRVHSFKEKDSGYLDARILGGFHCLVQSVAADAPMLPVSVFGGRLHPLAGHSAGSILPKSVWALNFSPSAPDPSAMVFVDFLGTWVDVYMDDADISWLSGDNAAIKDMDKLIVRMHPSVLSTAFGLSWFEMATALANEGKRLLTHDEFYAAAIGSNVGTFRDPATATFGGANRNATDSAGNRMVSNIGCEDMCGLFFQPLGNFGAPRRIGGSYTTGQTTPSWCGRDVLGRSIYLIVLLAGGGYVPDTSVVNRAQNTWQDCNAASVGPLCRNGRNSQDGPVCNMAPRGCCGTAYSF